MFVDLCNELKIMIALDNVAVTIFHREIKNWKTIPVINYLAKNLFLKALLVLIESSPLK